VFTCATQTNYFQGVEVVGTTGRLAVEVPFNAPERIGRRQITVADGMASTGGKVLSKKFPYCDQYTLSGTHFAAPFGRTEGFPWHWKTRLATMKVHRRDFSFREKREVGNAVTGNVRGRKGLRGFSAPSEANGGTREKIHGEKPGSCL